MKKAREQMAELLETALGQQPEPDGVSHEDRRIPGPKGAPEVRVRIYRPGVAGSQLPAVLYIHGGGFCVGSIEMEHVGAAGAALRAEAVVVSVEYRLAPEHPFPAGIEDCYAALSWMSSSPRLNRMSATWPQVTARE